MRQKDLWFESITTLNGGEDQALMGDSFLKEGISTGQHNSSLSRRGRGKITVVETYLSWHRILDLPLSWDVRWVHPAKHLKASDCLKHSTVSHKESMLSHSDSCFRFSVAKGKLQLSAVCQCSCFLLLCVKEQPTCQRCQRKRQWASGHGSAEAAAWHGQCVAQAARSGGANADTGERPRC